MSAVLVSTHFNVDGVPRKPQLAAFQMRMHVIVTRFVLPCLPSCVCSAGAAKGTIDRAHNAVLLVYDRLDLEQLQASAAAPPAAAAVPSTEATEGDSGSLASSQPYVGAAVLRGMASLFRLPPCGLHLLGTSNSFYCPP